MTSRSTEKNPKAQGIGGPGSSHQDAKQGEADSRPKGGPKHETQPGDPTNPDRSRVSSGGGERDRHHTHTDERS